MYGWIWRHLPGGTPGRLIGSLALAAAAVALLWFVAFPAIRPLMPWSNIDVGPAPVDNEEVVDDEPTDDGSTCTPGVDCENSEFDPEDYETAAPPEDDEDGADG